MFCGMVAGSRKAFLEVVVDGTDPIFNLFTSMYLAKPLTFKHRKREREEEESTFFHFRPQKKGFFCASCVFSPALRTFSNQLCLSSSSFFLFFSGFLVSIDLNVFILKGTKIAKNMSVCISVEKQLLNVLKYFVFALIYVFFSVRRNFHSWQKFCTKVFVF